MIMPDPQSMRFLHRAGSTYRGYRGPFTHFVRRRDGQNIPKIDRRLVGGLPILRRGPAPELSPCAEGLRRPSAPSRRKHGVIL